MFATSGCRIMDHSQAVCPTGPMCWHTCPPSALQPTSPRSNDRLATLCLSVFLGKAQELCEALPTGFVVGCSKLSHFIGWNAPQRIRCTGVSAEEEEEPRALQVLNRLDAFVEGCVLFGGRHELGLNMAHWDAQHSDPLARGLRTLLLSTPWHPDPRALPAMLHTLEGHDHRGSTLVSCALAYCSNDCSSNLWMVAKMQLYKLCRMLFSLESICSLT